jgi:hypothetical protein
MDGETIKLINIIALLSIIFLAVALGYHYFIPCKTYYSPVKELITVINRSIPGYTYQLENGEYANTNNLKQIGDKICKEK